MIGGRTRWLGRELLVRLMLPLVLIMVAWGALGTYTSQHLTDRVFDRWLLDAARSLAQEVRFIDGQASVELPPVAHTVLTYDDVDHVYYSVVQKQRHLLGQPDLPEVGTRQAQYRDGRVFDAKYHGVPVRVAAVTVGDGHGANVTVLMAETTLKRQRTQREVLETLLPLALLLLLAAVVAIGWGVLRTVRPLALIASRWSNQSHASLAPISADDLPRELMPFGSALNELLGRIRAMLSRELQFVSTVAHQLRTPLAGFRLGLARAAQAPDLASAQQVLRELDQTTTRTARLLQQLLSLGRLDPEARGDLDFTRTELASLVHDVGSAYLEFALDKQIDLELRAPPESVYTVAQPELLSEALGNLLDNALRYTPRGGRVLIEVEAAPPSIRISDSGPGVPEAERELIFERLVRGSQALGEGSGLGLAIVRDIAALHGASVMLETGSLGGTSVVLRFDTPSP